MSLGDVPLVLVIDDDPDQLELVRVAAHRAGGVRVLSAASGTEALLEVQTRAGMRLAPPDLVLTDMKMPDMTGLELMRALRERPELERVPVFFLTSSAYNRDRVLAHMAGADGFFQKPIRFAGLVAIMKVLPSLVPHLSETEEEAETPSIIAAPPLPRPEYAI